ncbi:MAG: anthranilate synthase component 2 [Alphaproteobacteria bacterium]|jgi:anthranilate synthase component 2
MIVLIDNYDSFTYNLAHYFGQLGQEVTIYRNDDLSTQKILNGKHGKPKAIILSPGPKSPEQAGVCVPLIQQSEGTIPIFGVCLGHQSIAYAFGGDIIRAPEPVHGKVKNIIHQGHSLFYNVPETFPVTRYHSLIADPQTLPTCLNVIATSAEPKDQNMIMAVAHKQYPIFGVQFHPESIRTIDGLQIIKNFLEYVT